MREAAGPSPFLVEAVGPLPPGDAADLACGEGRNARWLARQGWRVTGVDFSQVAIDRARTLAHSEGLAVRFEVADLLDWQPHEAGYDLVTIVRLQLPHSEMARVFAAAGRALRPGGLLFAEGHHLENLTRGHGGPPTADVLYTEHDLARWANGLQVERAETVSLEVVTDDGPGISIEALMVARRI